MKIDTIVSVPPYFPMSDEPAPQILFIQHFNLLCDERMSVWENAITDTVKENDLVVELGSGTGILSMIAARKTKNVIAVEMSPHLAQYSRYAIEKNGFSDRIKVFCSDARDLDLKKKADVIICEMLDTGLIKEQLVQVMNEIGPRLIGEKTRIIPSKVVTSLILSHTDFDFSGFCMPLPHFETKEVRKTVLYFSDSIPYHTVNLREQNPTEVNAHLQIPITKSGEVNSMKIITDAELCDGKLCSPSHWFNPPLVLPVEPLNVKEGEMMTVNISYKLGEGLKTLKYDMKKN